MKDSGVALMGYGEAEGMDRARTAIHMALTSPLLEENDIRGAKHPCSTSHQATKQIAGEIGEITDYVQEEAGFGTDLIWAMYGSGIGVIRSVLPLLLPALETGNNRVKTIHHEPKSGFGRRNWKIQPTLIFYSVMDATPSSKTIEFGAR